MKNIEIEGALFVDSEQIVTTIVSPSKNYLAAILNRPDGGKTVEVFKRTSSGPHEVGEHWASVGNPSITSDTDAMPLAKLKLADLSWCIWCHPPEESR